jgi:hemerythrin-like domain-containing protein
MAARGTKKKSTDAIALLKADHSKVKAMFKQFEKMHDAQSDEEAQQLAQQICDELKIHTALEEEIFYPEIRQAIDDNDLMNEAEVEHASAKELIGQIESSDGAEESFAAKVMVLGEYINHHIKEEQEEMFPKARKSDVDLKEMGERIMFRKEELMTEMGIHEGEGARQSGTARTAHTAVRASRSS